MCFQERFHVEPCTPNDLDAIQQIENASFDHPFSRSLFESLLMQSPRSFRVAKEERRVLVGYCITVESGDDPRIAVIASIAVSPNCRRMGIGELLLRDAFSIAKEIFPNARMIELEVSEKNFAAISLYEKKGFQKADLIPNYYGPGEHAYVMLRSLW